MLISRKTGKHLRVPLLLRVLFQSRMNFKLVPTVQHNCGFLQQPAPGRLVIPATERHSTYVTWLPGHTCTCHMAKDPAPMFIPKRSGSSIHSAACAIVMSRRNTPPGRPAVPWNDGLSGAASEGKHKDKGSMSNIELREQTIPQSSYCVVLSFCGRVSDFVASSWLASCITIMGIVCREHGENK